MSTYHSESVFHAMPYRKAQSLHLQSAHCRSLSFRWTVERCKKASLFRGILGASSVYVEIFKRTRLPVTVIRSTTTKSNVDFPDWRFGLSSILGRSAPFLP